MTTAERRRILAPLYALAVSFLLVFTLGAALDHRDTRIRFLVQGENGSTEAAPGLDGSRVRVSGEKDATTLADPELRRSAAAVLKPAEDFDVCLTLPAGLSAVTPTAREKAARQATSAGQSCWEFDQGTHDVTILLARRAS